MRAGSPVSWFTVLGLTVPACSTPSTPPEPTAAVASTAPLPAGLDTAGMNTAVVPGDDFYAYANGAWLKATPIPADKASYGAASILVDRTRQQTVTLIQDAGHSRRRQRPGAQGRRLLRRLHGRGRHRGQGTVAAEAGARGDRRDRRPPGPRPGHRRHHPRRRRSAERHQLPDRAPVRRVGCAGPARAWAQHAVPAAGRPWTAGSRLLRVERRRRWPPCARPTRPTSRRSSA